MSDAGDEQRAEAEAGSDVRPARVRGRASAALIAIALVGVVSTVGLLSFQFIRPSGAEAPEDLVANVGRWSSDPGAVYDRTPVTPTPSPVPTPTPVPPPPDSVPYQMIIDTIGVNAPVVAKGVDANNVPIVPLNSYQVAWYTFSSQPGNGGNAIFAGHVTWSGRAVFYNLHQLAAGDTIRLVSQEGDEFTYTVTESYLVGEHDQAAAAQVMGQTPTDVVTLITCDGDFYYTGDPVFRGSYTQRRVVRAALTSENVVSALGSNSGN